MDAKLTLKLNQKIIEKAKEYASDKKMSLSRIVESYFQTLTADPKDRDIEITPLVKSLSGVIKLDKDFDHKEEYANYLMEKYK